MIEMEQLLRNRYRREPITDDEHRETEMLARVVAGVDDPAQRSTATTLTVQNRELAEAVLLVSGGASLHPASRGTRKLLILGGAIAALVLISLPSLHPPRFDSDSELVPKGLEDRFDVAAQRGEERFRLRPQDAIRTGDRLGFFYSARRPGYLAVLSVDESGAVSVLQPNVHIDSGEEVPLRDGAIADDGGGCEWIVAVFSDESISVDEMTRQIESAPRTRVDCALTPVIAGARAVRVVPLKR